MITRITGFAALMVGLAGGAMAADPPETTVQFDLQWLSPPEVTPAGGQAVAQQTPDYTRLQGAANVGGSFTWPLRYAVGVQQYPILTLRYRARDLSVGPTYANRIMDVQLVDSGGRMNSLTVINYEDLVQDGTVHEIRKDLSQVPADAFIDQMRFNFQGATAGGRLDIYSITLDRGPNSPEPMKFEQRPVEFVVKDAAGNAVPDAEVHLGLLERSNWVALGSTDAQGRVVLTTLAQTRPDGTMDPVEAVVVSEGNLPQYVAPIKLPATGPVEVKLSPVPQAQTPPQGAPPAQPASLEPAQPVAQAEPVYYETPVYVPYPVYYYNYVYTYSTPVYWWVPTHCVRTRPTRWCDRDDRWREHHGDHHDNVRWYDHPRPATPPSRNNPPTRVGPPQRMDHGRGLQRPDDGLPNPARDRDARPVVAPPPRHQAPPDLRDRNDRGRPVMVNEPVIGSVPGKISTPPRGTQEGQGRDSTRRDNRDDSMSAPRRGDSGPTRTVTPQPPAPSVINTPDRPERNEPAPRVDPPSRTTPSNPPARVQRDDQARGNQPVPRVDPPSHTTPGDPPARVQRDDQAKGNQPAPRVDPPSRTTPSDPPARVQRGNDDDQRRQIQREDVARRVASESSRSQGQRDAMQHGPAQRDPGVRRDDSRRVTPAPTPAPPLTIARNDAGRRGSAQADGSATDQDSGNAAHGRSSRR